MASKPEMSRVKPRFIFACECENVPTVDLEMAATHYILSKKMNKIAANIILSPFWFFSRHYSEQTGSLYWAKCWCALSHSPPNDPHPRHSSGIGLKKRTSQNHHTLCNLIWTKTNIRGHGNSKYFLEGQRNIFGRLEKHDGLDVRWINCRRPVPNPPKSPMRTNSSQFWFWFSLARFSFSFSCTLTRFIFAAVLQRRSIGFLPPTNSRERQKAAKLAKLWSKKTNPVVSFVLVVDCEVNSVTAAPDITTESAAYSSSPTNVTQPFYSRLVYSLSENFFAKKWKKIEADFGLWVCCCQND